MSSQRILNAIAQRLLSLAVLAGSALLTFVVLNGNLFGAGHSAVEEAVAAKLRDPASAKFRNIRGSAGTYCGEVNARNSFGGYVGFQDFAYQHGFVAIEPRPPVSKRSSRAEIYLIELREYLVLSADCPG